MMLSRRFRAQNHVIHSPTIPSHVIQIHAIRNHSTHRSIRLFAIAATLLPSLLLTPASHAETEAELLRLCSKFPYNSRCEGREPVVLLGDRPGEKVEICKLKIGPSGSSPLEGPCKLERTETGLNLYIANKRDRRKDVPIDDLYSIAVTIPSSQLILVDQTIATRVGGGFGPDYYSITQLGFFVSDPGPEQNRTNAVRIQGGRNFGNDLGRWLNDAFSAAPQTDLAQRLSSAELLPVPNPSEVQDNVETLLATRACLRCDLRGANLAGQDLGLVNLEGADLREADLSSVNLGESFLMGAKLDRAQLQGAQLSEAWGMAASFVEADLSEAKLHNLFFQDAVFDRAQIKQGRFDRLNQSTTLLQRASFVDANLEEASFEGAHLIEANFENANLAGANMSREPVQVQSDGFLGVLLSGASGPTSQSFSTLLTDANFSGANLQNTNMHYAQMENIDLSNADLSNANLNKSYLVNADLSGSNLTSSRMTYIDLSNADLSGANVTDTDFNRSRLCGATLPDGVVSTDGCE